jgi:hypothetical protein
MSTGPVSASGSAARLDGRAGLALVLALLALAVVFTAPLAAHLASALPYAAVPPAGWETVGRIQGDHLQFYYYLWLVRDRLGAGASPLRDPYQFAVDGPRPNLPNVFLPAALAYLPLAVLDPRLGYNLLVLLSFPAAGLAAALLARRYGARPEAAALAGVVFACAPYRLGALLGGHPAGVAYALVPLALWGLEGALAGSRAGGAWCGIALLALAQMEPHFLYFAALGLPLYLLARVGLPAIDRAALRPGAGAVAVALAVAAAPAWGVVAALRLQAWTAPGVARITVGLLVMVAALAAWQGLAGWVRAAGLARDGRAAARWSLLLCLPWLGVAGAGGGRETRLVAVTAAVVPPLLHAAWLVLGVRRWWARRPPLAPLGLAAAGAVVAVGYLLALQALLLRPSVSGGGRTLHEVLLFSPRPEDLWTRVNPAAGRTIYPGLVALALAAAATVALARRPPAGPRRALLVYPPLLALALLLSLGPRLTQLPLFEVAFRLVPSWHFIRQPAKLQVLASLALAILAAVALDGLAGARAGRRARGALALGLGLLVAADYHPWRPAGVSRLPSDGPAYRAIREGGGRALYLPLWPGDSSYSALYLHTATLTRVPMLNGYSVWLDRSYLTDVYRPLEPVNLGQLGESEHAVLQRLGVRQVVLDLAAFPGKVSPFGPAYTRAALQASPFLDPVALPAEDGALTLFRVREHPRPPGADPPPSPLGVHWEAESLARDTGRVEADAAASSGGVVAAREGRDRAGFLAFGPYRLLPRGTFRALFRLRGADAGVEIQVATAAGRQILAAADVRLAGSDAGQEIPLAFSLDRATPVEYRVRWDGQGWAAIDTVSVTFAGVPDPPVELEAEALVHELEERGDAEASGGRTLHADPATTPRGAGWTGPLRRYPAGRYRLWIRVKVDAATAAPVARCDVQVASRGPVLAGRELLGSELPAPGRYVELALPFALDAPAILEFPCAYRGGAGLWVDRLRLERLAGSP